jgi:hypothetical protein
MDQPKTHKWVRCTACRRKVKHTADELVRFATVGWPLCCGEVMVLAESTEETPALPEGNPPSGRPPESTPTRR